VLAHLPDDLQPVFAVAYLTGWRVKSELLTRQRAHVDFQSGWLRLEPGETKNAEGRQFPLTPALRAVLERQRARTLAVEKATRTITLKRHPSVESAKSLKFANDTAFQLELRRRVDDFFLSTDCWQMYVKTAVFLAGFGVSYWLLVFVAQAWWQGVLLAILLGFSAAGIGFNIQHDGGHQAYSNRPWVNKLMAMTLELIGGSSYLWRWKHVVIHHTYVNITGHDTDIDLGSLARLTPHQERRPYHRWQHYYLWPLYGLLAIKWQLLDDFRKLISGRISNQSFPRPKGWELVIFVAGKAIFLTLAFGMPLVFHSAGAVLFYYVVAGLIAGIVLSVVFQAAHCVEEAEFPLPREDTGRIERAWAIHQADTTVDFARRSRVVTWLVGGLNFQIEHHLLPRISHVNYPAISRLVEETCRDFGIKYVEHRSFRAGMASHFRWLRRMGRPNAVG
jgi:linoleoyl-CoA desaturase